MEGGTEAHTKGIENLFSEIIAKTILKCRERPWTYRYRKHSEAQKDMTSKESPNAFSYIVLKPRVQNKGRILKVVREKCQLT
jgi:hypothetical protein